MSFKKFFIILFAVMLSVSLFANELHTVRAGETLTAIAEKYGTTPLDIAVVNNIDMSKPLPEGRTLIIVRLEETEIINQLCIPEKETKYTVKKGDTLYSIAKKHNTDAEELAKLNNISVNSKLSVGKVLTLVPGSVQKTVQISAKSSKKSNNAVNVALGLKGTRYISGGTSRGGFDCSGLTYYVYSQMGKTIPRTAFAQYRSGTAIDRKNLQKGDIVCFAIRGKDCSHVGIYIGNNKFLHASTPKTGVIISDLNEKYYSSSYLGARRY